MSSDNWLLFVGTVTYTFFFCLFNYGQIKWSSKHYVYSSNSKKLQGPKTRAFSEPNPHSPCCVWIMCQPLLFLFFFFSPKSHKQVLTAFMLSCLSVIGMGTWSCLLRFLECQNHVCSLFPSKQSQDNGERILVLGLWDIFFFEIAFNKSDLISWAIMENSKWTPNFPYFRNASDSFIPHLSLFLI